MPPAHSPARPYADARPRPSKRHQSADETTARLDAAMAEVAHILADGLNAPLSRLASEIRAKPMAEPLAAAQARESAERAEASRLVPTLIGMLVAVAVIVGGHELLTGIWQTLSVGGGLLLVAVVLGWGCRHG